MLNLIYFYRVASQFWTKSLNEYLCIDASEEISNLAEWFAKLSQPRIKNIFFKQYLPVTNNVRHKFFLVII